jgi:hypothetical protein
METKQAELIEKYHEFRDEVKALQKKPQAFGQELATKREKLERLRAGHESNLVLKRDEDTEILEQEIEKIEAEIKTLEFEAATFGGDQSEVVAGDPDSKLYNEAASIVKEAHAHIGPLEKELEEFIKFGLDEEKEKYLKVIGDFSEKMAALWNFSSSGMFSQKFLSKELQICKPPKLVAPDQGDLEIDAEQVSGVYRRLSKTAFFNI